MAQILDHDLLRSLVDALRAQGAPVADRLSPGLTDARIDELTVPYGITLPEEARVWWRFSNGVPREEGDNAMAIGSEWGWAALQEVLAIRSQMLRDFAREGLTLGEDVPWSQSWLPFVIRDRLAMETANFQHAPIFVANFHYDIDEQEEPSTGLREVVQTWIRAFQVAASVYDTQKAAFFVDHDKAAEAGIRTSFI